MLYGLFVLEEQDNLSKSIIYYRKDRLTERNCKDVNIIVGLLFNIYINVMFDRRLRILFYIDGMTYR